MAHEHHLLSDKNTRQQQQYPSPDTSFYDSAVSTTPAPPSPPPSSSSSSTSPPGPRPRSRRRRASPVALPTPVAPAFQCIRDSRDGLYAGPSWLKFTGVGPDDLDALVSAAECIGCYKIRYDYDPSKHFLTLRMPEGKPHNFIKTGLAGSIWKCLSECLDSATQQSEQGREHGWEAKLQAFQTIKASIVSTTEAATNLPTGEEKSPDVSFYYRDFVYPPLVVEVGHSQKSAELPILARQYIEKTAGDIHTVVTVDIAHNTPEERARERRRQRLPRQEEQGRETRSRSRQRREDSEAAAATSTHPFKFPASVSLFRLGKRVVHDRPFRDVHGDRVDGSLELNVADFVPLDTENVIPRSDLEMLTFTVPFSDLYGALIRGERQQLLEEKTPPPQATVRAGKKRVHFEFDWDLPEAGSGTVLELDPGGVVDEHQNLASRNLRSASASKKRRTDSDQGSQSPCLESMEGEACGSRSQGHVLQMRRRSSSRLRGSPRS